MATPDFDIKAFEMAAESLKQVLAYSTAVLTLTVTFAGDKLMGASTKIPRGLIVSWCLYLASIAAGIWTLNALTGELAISRPPNLYRANITIPAFGTYVSFLLGLVATVLAGYQSLKIRHSAKTERGHK
jgi:hypothetical protein